MTPIGFPHSDIRGSMHASCSPRRFAGCCVLHRLSVPRHPPCALANLPSSSATDCSSSSTFRQIQKLPPAATRSFNLEDSRLHFEDCSSVCSSLSFLRLVDDTSPCLENGLDRPCLYGRRRRPRRRMSVMTSRFLNRLFSCQRTDSVDPSGIEPLTSCLQGRRSPS